MTQTRLGPLLAAVLLVTTLNVVVASASARQLKEAVLTAELSVCASDPWMNLVHVKNPINVSDYSKAVPDWTAPDYKSYIGSSAIPRATASLVFVAFALCIVSGFFLWRLVRCSCICCGGKCKGTHITNNMLRGRTMNVTKVLGLLICLGIAGTAIYGLAAPMDNLAQQGWQVGGELRSYVQQVMDALTSVRSKLQEVGQQVSQTQQYVSPLQSVSAPQISVLVRILASIRASIDSIVADVSNYINTVQVNVADRYDREQAKWMQSSMDKWDVGVKVCYGLFGLALLIMVLVVAAALANWAFGIALMSVLQLALSILFFVIAAALAVGIVMLHDACVNMETITVQLAPQDAKQLVSYYLNPGSNPSDADKQLANAGIGLKEEVKVEIIQQLEQAKYSLWDPVYAKYVPASLKAYFDGSAQAALLSITGQASPPPSGALGLASLNTVQPMYITTKQYMCCTVPGLATRLWALATALGWLGLGLAAASMVLLGCLDLLQEAGTCCSCACLRPSKLPPAGKPFGVDEASVRAQHEPYCEVVRVDVAPQARNSDMQAPARQWF